MQLCTGRGFDTSSPSKSTLSKILFLLSKNNFLFFAVVPFQKNRFNFLTYSVLEYVSNIKEKRDFSPGHFTYGWFVPMPRNVRKIAKLFNGWMLATLRPAIAEAKIDINLAINRPWMIIMITIETMITCAYSILPFLPNVCSVFFGKMHFLPP